MQLRENILTERLDSLTCYNTVASSSLNHDLWTKSVRTKSLSAAIMLTKHLPVDMLFELGHPLPTDPLYLRSVHDSTDCINRRLIH